MPTFDMNYKLSSNDYLLRGRAYYIAKEDGPHTFYLTCKTRCQLEISAIGCDIPGYLLGSHSIPKDIKKENYDTDNQAKKIIDLENGQRYCITAFQKGRKGMDVWLAAGVKQPSGVEEYPFTSTFILGELFNYNVMFTYVKREYNDIAAMLASQSSIFDTSTSYHWDSSRWPDYQLRGIDQITKSLNGYIGIYISFYYTYTDKLDEFVVYRKDFLHCQVYIDRVAKSCDNKFSLQFENNVAKHFQIFFASKFANVNDLFRFRHKNNGVNARYFINNNMKFLGSDDKENINAPHGYAENATTLKVTFIKAPYIPTSSQMGELLSYRLVIRKNATNTEIIRDLALENSAHQYFYGLEIYTDYQIKILYIGQNYTVRSKERPGRTGEYYPSAAPSSFTATPQSSTSVNLVWGNINPVTARNGIILSYTVYHAEVDTDGNTIIGPWATTTVGNKSHDINNLKFWTYYAFDVSGSTSIGEGPKTGQLIRRTNEDAPTGPPTTVSGYNTSESKLKISWGPIDVKERNGIITGYKIKHRNRRSNVSGEVEVGPILTKEVTGLNHFQEYDIEVCGKTSVGYNKCSDPIIIKTDEWVPIEPPPNIRLKNLTVTTLEIEYDDIADPFYLNGYAINSKVEFEAIDEFFTQKDTVYGNVNEILIQGLNEFTNYSIRVAIGTRRGFGVFSSRHYFKTMGAPPSAPPKDIKSKFINSTAINLECGLIDYIDRNGIVNRYVFKTRQANTSEEWREIVVPKTGDTTKVDVGGLEKWRFYEYTVMGCTFGGCGNESKIYLQRTDQDIPEASPTNITITAPTSSSIKITWDEVPEGFRRGYIVRYHLLIKEDTFNPPRWLEKTVNAPKRELIFENLKYFTSYSVKIAAETIKGRGNHSILNEDSSLATLEDVPVVYPTNFSCNNASSSSLKCTWDKMLETYNNVNGEIAGYYIFYWVLDCAKAELKNCNESTIFTDTSFAPYLNYTIQGLEYFTEYVVQIQLFNNVALGPKSPTIIVSTDEDIPSSTPTVVEGFTMLTTSVAIFWDPVPVGTKHGIIIGYVCYYRRMNDGPPADELRLLMAKRDGKKRKRRSVEGKATYTDTRDESISKEESHKSRQKRSTSDGYLYPEHAQYVNATARGMEIVNLTKHQWYTLRLAAMTIKGPGPTFDLNVSCAQAVPTSAPNISIHDRFSFTDVSIQWNKLEYADSHGTVFDYNIIYYPVQKNGIDLSPFDQEQTSIWVEFPTQSLHITGLTPFVKYAFQSAALTFAGTGVYSKPFYAETCRCEKYFYAAYRDHLPYFGVDSKTGEQLGFMKDLIVEATQLCCGNCTHGHGLTEVVWTKDKYGNSAAKTTLAELNEAIINETEFVLPIETKKLNTIYKNQPFVGMVETAGVNIFSRKVDYLNPASTMMLYATSIIWTFVILMVLGVVALGMFMWIVQCHPLQLNRTNTKDFPDTFKRGAGAGIWWAFNTVLRVGYGDIVAIGKLGRLFSIPIMLIGICVSAIVIAGFTSMYLAYSMEKNEGSLFAKSVVAIKDAYANIVVTKAGGKVTEYANTAKDLTEALRSGRVDRIAVDSMYALHYSEEFSSPDVIVRDLRDSGSIHGVVFGGSAKRLKRCFRQYFIDQNARVAQRRQAIIDRDKSNYENNELYDKRMAILRYESKVWILSIQILGGLFFAAFIIGCIYEYRNRKTKVMAYMICHKPCIKFYEHEATAMLKDFLKQTKLKIEKMEVKHAFQRRRMMKIIKKEVEWLEPDQVNKYKF